MHKQLEQKPIPGARRIGLLLVLFFSIASSAFLLYHLREGIHALELQFINFQKAFLQPNNFNNGWVYLIIGVALLLMIPILYFLLREINIRRKINEELRTQKEHYHTIINSIDQGLIITGKNGEIRHMNPAAEKLTGWTILESKKLPLEKVYNIINEESENSLPNIVNRIFKKGEIAKVENNILLHAKNGNEFHISSTGSPLFDSTGNISGAVLVFNDITEKKRDENRLKKSLKLNKGMLNSLSSRIVVINSSGTIIKVNNSWNTFLLKNGGLTLENFGKGANYFDVWKAECKAEEDDPAKAIACIKEVLNGTLDEFYLEYPCRSSLEKRWFCMQATKFISTETLVVIEHTDITGRKNAEERMSKAIERYDILAQATSDTIWDWDVVSNKMLYTPSITKMFGYQVAEIENVDDWWKQNIHPDDLGLVSKSLAEAFENGLQTIQLDYRFRRADTFYRNIYDRAFVIYDDNQKAIRMIGAMQDVTYRKEEEKRIAKAIIDAQERERCYIGQELHDNINQILAGTHITLGMARDKSIDHEKMIEYIDISKGNITHAIDELRKLSHELVPASFDEKSLRNVFENLFVKINLNNRFDIWFHFDERINKAVNEEIQINLYRILQEQMKNIVEYSGANKIEIEVTLDNNVVRMRTFDNGKGFNTKQVKKGIGLSNIKKRVDSFSGKFILNSAPGEGCEIIVEISANTEEPLFLK